MDNEAKKDFHDFLFWRLSWWSAVFQKNDFRKKLKVAHMHKYKKNTSCMYFAKEHPKVIILALHRSAASKYRKPSRHLDILSDREKSIWPGNRLCTGGAHVTSLLQSTHAGENDIHRYPDSRSSFPRSNSYFAWSCTQTRSISSAFHMVFSRIELQQESSVKT